MKLRNTILKSFIPYPETSQFPIENLPYGIFQPGALSNARAGVAIGDQVLDLSVLEANDFFVDALGPKTDVFSQHTLNRFLELGKDVWHKVRNILQHVLSEDELILRDNDPLRKLALIPQNRVRMLIPVQIGDYTDFYSSQEHARNVGSMFRGAENPLLPNWKHLPVAYHGRASSIVLSGTDIIRPQGQRINPKTELPDFGPTEFMDFELEMGFIIGRGNKRGQPVSVDDAADHIFGMVIVNDWSARDIQRWEYQPLGPFLSKNFATTISPWIVSMEALMPFICDGPKQDPQPLPYLQTTGRHNFDINLSVSLQTEKMDAPEIISQSNMRYLYWNINQQLAHHTCNGCHIRSGDLMASGTISGPDASSWGSMLELAWNKTRPLKLASGESRSALNDHDTVILDAWGQGEGYRIGFGGSAGRILPADSEA